MISSMEEQLNMDIHFHRISVAFIYVLKVVNLFYKAFWLSCMFMCFCVVSVIMDVFLFFFFHIICKGIEM